MPRDPTNLYRRRNVARSCQNLGLREYELGRHSEALEPLERCCRLLEEVVRIDPANSTYQCDLAEGYVNQSHILGRRMTGSMNRPGAVAGPSRSMSGC